MQLCPPLSELHGKTGKDLVDKLVEVSEQYYECADKHQALVEFEKGRK